jgi:crotonobetainyl-CoA:carnitine CoA-transferase CaiB-like acyl-CoA transferase
MHQHSNRGKRSLALDLSAPEGVDILYNLVATSDVFLTNKLPRVRKNLKIDVADIRAHNPSIIYVRGSGQGERGPDSDRGSYDLLSFWHRSGVSMGLVRPDGQVPFLAGPGFGDSTGGMTIAGGVMGALFHRERTGEATVVDVSLLATGMWGMGQGIALSLLLADWSWPPNVPNPLSATYCTRDGSWLALCCLQAGHYWGSLCECLGRPDLVTDPRFADHASLLANHTEASAVLCDVFARRTIDDWRDRLESFVGQWTVVQDMRTAGKDPQALANGYVQQCESASGFGFELVAAPVQFDEMPATPRRAPDFNEHGDAILTDIGLDLDAIMDLKVRGVVG